MSLRQILKSGTNDLHKQIEQTAPMKKLFHESFSTADYKVYLTTQYRIFYHLEKVLKTVEGLDQCIPLLLKRWKTPSLQKDLGTIEAPEEISFPFSTLNLSQALGVLYVLEGSSLGSQLIYRKLMEKFAGLNVSFYFLNHHGDDLSQSWKDFVSALEQADFNVLINPEESLEAARAVFSSLIEIGSAQNIASNR